MCKAIRWEASNWPGPSVPTVIASDLSYDQAEKAIGADMKVRHYNQKRLHEGFWGSWNHAPGEGVIHYEIVSDENPLTKMGA